VRGGVGGGGGGGGGWEMWPNATVASVGNAVK